MIQFAAPTASRSNFIDRLKNIIPDFGTSREATIQRSPPLLEGLEMRRLLASISHSDFTTTTATAAALNTNLSAGAISSLTTHDLTTSDNWRFVNVAFAEALTVPQFNAAPGQVLTKVVIEGNLGLLQDFNGSVTNNNGVPIGLVANGSATVAFDSSTLDLDAAVEVEVDETIPADFLPHSFAEHDIDGQGTDYDDLGDSGVLIPNSPVSSIELTSLDGAAFDAFKGAGNVNFQVTGTSTTAFNFLGGGNEVQNLKFVTVGRADLKVTYIFGAPQARISIAPDDVNEVGDPHTFTVTVEQNDGLAAGEGGDGVDGFVDSTVGNVDVTLTGSNGAVPVLNAAASTTDDSQPSGDNLDNNGQAVAVFTSGTAGLVTGHATATLSILGQTVVVESDGLGANSDDALKRFVDAFITITPDDVNEVGDPHTFTVTVMQDDGLSAGQGGDGVSGFTPATAGNVDLTLTGSNGAVPVLNAAASTTDDGQPNGDNLNASGQAIAVFSSATAGLVTGHATVTLVLGGVTLTRQTDGSQTSITPPSGVFNSGDAVKRFVDAFITITPDDVNDVNDPHTFTITVRQDDGLNAGQGGDGVTGFTPATLGNVDLTLTGSNGAAPVLNAAASTTDDGQPNGDNLNAIGQAIGVFTSATAGLVNGHATVTLVVGGVTLVRETDGSETTVGSGVLNGDDALKRFVNVNITITPDGLNPVGAPHTFVATVLKDDGINAGQDITGDAIADGDNATGFTPAVGAPITITLTNSGGAVAVPAGPFVNVTNASGQFSVTFTSLTPGFVTGNAYTQVSFPRLATEQPPATALVVQRDTDPATASIGAGPGGSGPAVKEFFHDEECFVLIIDEDGIDDDMRSVELAARKHNTTPQRLINDDRPTEGLNKVFRWNEIGVGDVVKMPTGQVKDEGYFQLPANFEDITGYTVQQYVDGVVPQSALDKIDDVMPLRNQDLKNLVGKCFVAVVYDSDISINYKPLNGNLQGARLGLFYFEVLAIEVSGPQPSGVGYPGSLPESRSDRSLYDLWLKVVEPFSEYDAYDEAQIREGDVNQPQITKASQAADGTLTVWASPDKYPGSVGGPADDSIAYMTVSIDGSDKGSDPNVAPLICEVPMIFSASRNRYEFTQDFNVNLKGRRLSIQDDEGGVYNVLINGKGYTGVSATTFSFSSKSLFSTSAITDESDNHDDLFSSEQSNKDRTLVSSR